VTAPREPGEPPEAPVRPLRRAVLVTLGVAPAVVAVFVFVFMARSEVAFDEATCPFVNGATRTVAEGVAVREDARRCQPEVEERRWVLLRDGEAPVPIGRRRLGTAMWGEGYAWEATIEEGRVHLLIRNPGQRERRFVEMVPDGGPRAPW
jgi:hypothetical protein